MYEGMLEHGKKLATYVCWLLLSKAMSSTTKTMDLLKSSPN